MTSSPWADTRYRWIYYPAAVANKDVCARCNIAMLPVSPAQRLRTSTKAGLWVFVMYSRGGFSCLLLHRIALTQCKNVSHCQQWQTILGSPLVSLCLYWLYLCAHQGDPLWHLTVWKRQIWSWSIPTNSTTLHWTTHTLSSWEIQVGMVHSHAQAHTHT